MKTRNVFIALISMILPQLPTVQGDERYTPVDEAAMLAYPDKQVQYDESRMYLFPSSRLGRCKPVRICPHFAASVASGFVPAMACTAATLFVTTPMTKTTSYSSSVGYSSSV